MAQDPAKLRGTSVHPAPKPTPIRMTWCSGLLPVIGLGFVFFVLGFAFNYACNCATSHDYLRQLKITLPSGDLSVFTLMDTDMSGTVDAAEIQKLA
eukprot:5224129-Pyramimonas_sp.AAC.1